MRLRGTKTSVISTNGGLGDQLWDLGGARPSLDLNFAHSKDLTDATTGSNLVDFTRASSGTYVGSDGLIKSATTNLLLRSEEFDNASWSKSQGSVTANILVAPDGEQTADLFAEDTASSAHQLFSVASFVAGTSYTFSVFAKSLNRGVRLSFGSSAFSVGVLAVFDLQTGTAAVTSGTASAVIQPLSDSWFRCSVTATATTTTTTAVAFALLSAGSAVYTGDGTSGIYLWGAQLEQSSTVGEYVKTTSTINSAPRFDHDPTTGESLGLLVEESRTNVVVNSQSFTSSTGATATNNAATSPLGTVSAATLIEDGTTGNHAASSDLFTVTAVATTFSFFAKANGRDWIALRFQGVTRAWFNISTGAVGTVDGSTTALITPYGNGFYRCTATLTPTAGNANMFLRMGAADGVDSYVGDGTSGVILFGMQAEAGSGPPTSYIPTEGSAVTRAADVASITGTNFSSFYNQNGGTVFVDVVNRETFPGTNQFPYIAQIDNGSNTDRVSFDHSVLNTGYRCNIAIRQGDVSQGEFGQFGFASGVARWAVSMKTNDFAAAFSVAPGQVFTRTTATLPSIMTRMQIAAGFGKRYTGTIRRLTYWPARLPNETLQTITQ